MDPRVRGDDTEWNGRVLGDDVSFPYFPAFIAFSIRRAIGAQ
jgi:hypothetical protein